MKKTKQPYKTGEKALTKKEAEAVIMAATSYEDKLLVLMGFTYGPRRDDLVRTKIQDIDIAAGTLSYLEKKKGDRIKTIPLSDRLKHELDLYIKAHTVPGQVYLFPPRQKTHNCGHMSSRTAYNIFNDLCKKVGIPTPIPIHAMRSTCIKIKQAEGWTIEQTAALIGDTVATVQEHYATPSMGDLQKIMKERPGV